MPNIQANDICYLVLNHINDILHSMGHNVNEFKLILKNISSATSSSIIQQTKDIHLERNIIVTTEDLLLHTHLNKEQQKAYNAILTRISLNKSGAFFIDGPGGTGKTLLLQLLYFLADELLIHALNFLLTHVCTCNISKQSSLASLIQDAKLIIWDEDQWQKKKTC
ncbi:hypothetical protein H5410_064281 [Solanum commersonii]|uniref:ATP-dependent DNA helicase n=1 Tax=Solanum commersonii TaxID=4109 RepID=A0A9J5VZR6_SOLCO|nr:hypothetical protein H5410_064281 [Solanum commersonii]